LPLIVKTPKNEVETREAEEERENKSAADWWMVRFTAVLGFIGLLQFLALVGQGIVFWIQAKRLGQSIDLSRKIADRQGSDTRQMIETEGFTLNTIKYIADRGLRPYIAFDLSSIIILNIDHLSYRISVKNQGHTPAYELRINGGINHNNSRLFESTEFVTTTEIFLPIIYAGEKHEVTIVSEKMPAKKEIERLLSSEDFRLYLYGKVSFRDVFQNTGDAPRYSRFRVMVERDDQAHSYRFIPCAEGNETSENQ
jgi:hypothetical protein